MNFFILINSNNQNLLFPTYFVKHPIYSIFLYILLKELRTPDCSGRKLLYWRWKLGQHALCYITLINTTASLLQRWDCTTLNHSNGNITAVTNVTLASIKTIKILCICNLRYNLLIWTYDKIWRGNLYMLVARLANWNGIKLVNYYLFKL